MTRGVSALKSGGSSLSLIVSFCSFQYVDNDPWEVDRKSGGIISSTYNSVVRFIFNSGPLVSSQYGIVVLLMDLLLEFYKLYLLNSQFIDK